MESDQPSVSIIIPTLNEEEQLEALLEQLSRINLPKEIIIVDGGSEDQTTTIAQSFSDHVILSEKGRGCQLAKGAEMAKAEHLLFLHADVLFMHEPTSVLKELIASQSSLASFKLQFDKEHWFLKLNAFFSGFPFPYFHFGDQGLWISRKLYHQVGGFDPEQKIFEDQDLYLRANRIAKGIKAKNTLRVSARRYMSKGVYQLQFFYYKLWFLKQLAYEQRKLEKRYQEFFEL